jgi:hypothetical protein
MVLIGKDQVAMSGSIDPATPTIEGVASGNCNKDEHDQKLYESKARGRFRRDHP